MWFKTHFRRCACGRPFCARISAAERSQGKGCNIAGSAVCEGGFQIDLSGMKAVHIDVKSRTAHVEPGATLGDFDHEAQEFGLATPLGINNSTTGVAGFGWFPRKHGMTIDNLKAADAVTADGRLLRANSRENPDLFWAIRGGSGNFGIVTRFEFKLHSLGPDVLTGIVAYSLDEGALVLKQYRDYVKSLETTPPSGRSSASRHAVALFA
jgi:FAD/FMN-containing dehydrogenase